MHENLSKSAKQNAPKRLKTVETYNANLAPGMSASGDTWSSDELKKLVKAAEACNKRWKDVAAAVGSRNLVQCRDKYGYLRKLKRLDPISEDTPLRAGIFTGFHKSAFKKCITKIDGKNITTVGELAALDLGDIARLKKMTKCNRGQAVEMGARWKGMAEEALAFWK